MEVRGDAAPTEGGDRLTYPPPGFVLYFCWSRRPLSSSRASSARSVFGRSTALSASRRYYPGFFAALFLILLRTAIGWHFLYEGMEKLYPPEGKAFSAEGYLRAATGPLAPFFRSHIPDASGLARFERDAGGLPAKLKASWAAELNRFANHYGLTSTQRAEAEKSLSDASAKADAWFRNIDNAEKLKKYEDDLKRVDRIERDPKALDYQRKLAYKDRREIDKTRRDINADIDAIEGALRDSWAKQLTKEQAGKGPIPRPWTDLDRINLTTKILLVAAGAGLMLGLLTRLSALGAAAFLAMTYLTMPPWPGLPESPASEGHYLFINKNAIEFLACMALVFLPTGRWVGLDSLLFGLLGGRRDRRVPAEAVEDRRTESDHSRHRTLTRRAR